MTQLTAHYLVVSTHPEPRMIPASSQPLARMCTSVAIHYPYKYTQQSPGWQHRQAI